MAVQIPSKNKSSGYSAFYIGRKKNKNSSIDLNKQNYTVRFSDISCHKEPIIPLEIKQDKEATKKEANK